MSRIGNGRIAWHASFGCFVFYNTGSVGRGRVKEANDFDFSKCYEARVGAVPIVSILTTEQHISKMKNQNIRLLFVFFAT